MEPVIQDDRRFQNLVVGRIARDLPSWGEETHPKDSVSPQAVLQKLFEIIFFFFFFFFLVWAFDIL